VLCGPGPTQTEMGVARVVVEVKGEEENDRMKVEVKVGGCFVQLA